MSPARVGLDAHELSETGPGGDAGFSRSETGASRPFPASGAGADAALRNNRA